ncbi:unnamed protein product [Musa banksii]
MQGSCHCYHYYLYMQGRPTALLDGKAKAKAEGIWRGARNAYHPPYACHSPERFSGDEAVNDATDGGDAYNKGVLNDTPRLFLPASNRPPLHGLKLAGREREREWAVVFSNP